MTPFDISQALPFDTGTKTKGLILRNSLGILGQQGVLDADYEQAQREGANLRVLVLVLVRVLDLDLGVSRCYFLVAQAPTSSAPFSNTLSSPGRKVVQTSLVVSGAVTTMATRSLGWVCSAKLMLRSSSLSLACVKGWRRST